MSKDKDTQIEKTDEELTSEIKEEYGWDEDDDKDKIDKVLDLKKSRFSATKQKKSAQKLAQDMEKGKDHYKSVAKKALGGKKPKVVKPTKEDAKVDANKIEGNIMDKLALKGLGLDDDTAKEVQDFAKFKGISVEKAIETPVIKKVIAEYKDKQNTSKSTLITKKKSSSGKDSYNFERLKNASADEVIEYVKGLDTESEEYEKFMEWEKKQN